MDLTATNPDHYQKEVFSKLQLTGARITNKEFDTCTFRSNRLISCTFTDCTFSDCTFTASLLSAVQFVNCSFMETKFTAVKTLGIDWSKTASMRHMIFEKCELQQSNFSFAKVPHLTLTHCTARECYFTQANCTDADFTGTDFSGSIFNGTNLTKANFSGATNYAIDIRANTVKQAKFSLPEAVSLLRSLEITLTD